MGVNAKQMMFELWSNKKYDSFVVDGRPTLVVLLNLFYISYVTRSPDLSQYTQWCSFIENMNITNSYSLEWFIKIYIGCNLWFNKFTLLEDDLYPWLRTTGLGKYLCFAFLLLHSLCPHSFNNHLVNPSIIWHVAYLFSQISTNLNCLIIWKAVLSFKLPVLNVFRDRLTAL